MLHTLRCRLVLSHVLPLLVITPLAGIALIYALETQVLLPTLAHELTGQAKLVAELAATQPILWDNQAQAQAFADQIGSHLSARVMLLDARGRLLASSDPADVGQIGRSLTLPDLTQALAGETRVHTEYSHRLHAEIADILIPVPGRGLSAIGVVRLTHRLINVNEPFLRLRYLIGIVLTTGLLLGVAVGWVLASGLEHPLLQVTRAVYQLASDQRTTPLPEQGPAEIRLLARAINTLAERRYALEQARRQLLANLVHELGRPLGAISSAIQALRGGADEDIALRQELLAGIDEEIGRLQRLLDDLTQHRNQILGLLELRRCSIALSDWLPSVLAPWQMAARGKGLRWEMTMSTELPTLMADPDRLAQILGNLLSNAIKYTPSGGTISVSVGARNAEVWIQVSDTGPGIMPEEQTRIFSPFYRGNRARRFPQGMGLGLTIAHDLAIAHGGRLEVESAPGQGSRFTLWLPLH